MCDSFLQLHSNDNFQFQVRVSLAENKSEFANIFSTSGVRIRLLIVPTSLCNFYGISANDKEQSVFSLIHPTVVWIVFLLFQTRALLKKKKKISSERQDDEKTRIKRTLRRNVRKQ